MMKIHIIILIIIIKVSLQKLDLIYCVINGKIKKEPKNLELRYKCSKKRAIPFPMASSKFRGKWQIPWHGVKIHMPWNTAGPDYINAFISYPITFKHIVTSHVSHILFISGRILKYTIRCSPSI